MKKFKNPGDIVNPHFLPPGSRIYCSGNAATPKVLLNQLAGDTSIRDVELLSVLLLGDIEDLFSEETCRRVTHRIIFNSHLTRAAVNSGCIRRERLIPEYPGILLNSVVFSPRFG